MNVTTIINNTTLLVAALGTLLAAGDSLSEQVLRPKCNVKVDTFDQPKQSVVPIGTVLHKCPNERSGVEGKLVAEGYFRLVGEYGDWYEYEGKAGRIGYFRKAGVTMRAAPEIAAAGANASTPSTSGSAAVGGAVATATTDGIPVSTSAGAIHGQAVALLGVEYEKTSLPCPKPTQPGKAPAMRPPGFDVNVYVPDEFDMTNDALVKQVLLYGAERYRRECGATGATVRVLPKSDKSFVAGKSTFGIYRRDAETTTVEEWAQGDVSSNSGVQDATYRNYERDRIRKCEPVTAFYKRTKAQQYVYSGSVTKNPFALQGKIVVMKARFEKMEGPTEATFEGEEGHLYVTNVPTTRFTDSRQLLLVVRVKGQRMRQTPLGGEMAVADLSFVDAYETDDDSCKRDAIRFAKRP